MYITYLSRLCGTVHAMCWPFTVRFMRNFGSHAYFFRSRGGCGNCPVPCDLWFTRWSLVLVFWGVPWSADGRLHADSRALRQGQDTVAPRFVSRTCRYHCECTRTDWSAPIRLDSEKVLTSNKGPLRQELGTLLFCVVAGFMNSGWFRTLWHTLATLGDYWKCNSQAQVELANGQVGRVHAPVVCLEWWSEINTGYQSHLPERERERKLLSVSVSRHDFKPSTLIHRFWVWKRNVGTFNMPQLQVCMCVFSRNRQVGVEGRRMMKRSTHCAILCIGLSFDGKIHTFVSASFVWYEVFDSNACLACSLV